MITDLRICPHDSEIVRAVGPRYDIGMILRMASVFVQVFVASAAKHVPGPPARYRIGRDGDDARAGISAFKRMRTSFCERRARFDVDDFECRFDAGTLSLRARLLGWDALYLDADGVIRTVDGGSWDGFDPTPMIAIRSRDQTMNAMSTDQRRIVTMMCRVAADEGGFAFQPAQDGLVDPHVAFLRFPHERFSRFGTSSGDLRIRLVR